MALGRALLAALLGALTSLPLVALYYAGSRLAGLPFVPFDVFDWLARVLPGPLITPVIDALVAAANSLRLGPTSTIAKGVEQLMAVAVFVGAAAVGGIGQFWLGRGSVAKAWPGLVTGALFGMLLIAVELAFGFAFNPNIVLFWLLLPPLVWGAALWALMGAVWPAERQTADMATKGTTRRAALVKIAGGSVGVALALWGLGALAGRDRDDKLTGPPAPGSIGDIPAPPPGRIEPAPGARSEVTPNDSFYRVDINLLPVVVDGSAWRLETKGLFARARNLTMAEVQAYPAVTAPVTLTCISNPVGGDLIGNAYWTGVRLRDLLEDLGMRPETKEIFIQSTDGFYETVTAADMMDPRTLLVYQMNGLPLPQEHGYPLRILIPDRFGMKQPKWIISLEAKGEEERRGYWPEREWSEEALVQIMSQLDDAVVDPADEGKVLVSGIAFTGAQGVSRVEVQVEGGPWEEATLRVPPLGELSWVQWRYEWPRQSGNWVFRVRAADGRGNRQIERRAGPRPDGATGLHVISRRV